jgi:hypothetical protein
VAIERVDLGVCPAYVHDGDAARTAVVLPGRMLGGMPVNGHAVAALNDLGWRVVQVWDECLDVERRAEWARERARAALTYAGGAQLLVGKSMATFAADVARDERLPAVWLTPLLVVPECVELLRAHTAPVLLVGGTADEAWDGDVARSLSDDVLELDGADHGLARIDQLQPVVDAVQAFAARI